MSAAGPWLPMRRFPRVKAKTKFMRNLAGYSIRYYLMRKKNGDTVANWYVGNGSGWFFGEPKDFFEWAEISCPFH
jgi:hypothetical protein